MPRVSKKIVFQRKGPSGKFEENVIGGHRQKQIRTLDLPASQTKTIRSILKEERTNRNKVLSPLPDMGDQVDTAEPHFHRLCRIVLNNADIKPDLRESIMFKSFIEYQRDTGYCARSSELPFILCHTIL